MKIDKFYMCHYQKLTERREYVEKVLSTHNIEVNWVLDFDKEALDKESLSKTYPFLFSNKNGRYLSLAEISLVLKHKYVFDDVVKNNYQNVVVFEDDIILVDDFNNKLNNYMEQLPSDYDILWIGTCCNLHANNISVDKNVYEVSHGSRCTHAYVISNSACRKINDIFDGVYQPIDWFFNSSIKTQNMRNFWAEPELSTQDLSFNSAINCGTVK
jgi:GR25 family glycosyltransferase involved in LPS biosynthesis